MLEDKVKFIIFETCVRLSIMLKVIKSKVHSLKVILFTNFDKTKERFLHLTIIFLCMPQSKNCFPFLPDSGVFFSTFPSQPCMFLQIKKSTHNKISQLLLLFNTSYITNLCLLIQTQFFVLQYMFFYDWPWVNEYGMRFRHFAYASICRKPSENGLAKLVKLFTFCSL